MSLKYEVVYLFVFARTKPNVTSL